MKHSHSAKIRRNLQRISRRVFLGFTALIALVGLTASLQAQSETALDHRNPRVQEVMAIQNSVTPDLMKIEGILGTATGLNAQDQVAVVIYVDERGRNQTEIVRAMPKEIRGASVVIELTEQFRALKGKPEGGGKPAPDPAPTFDHKAKQTLPIQLGTSGGWGYDLANGYCCGGTLGSLVTKGGKKYILSNYHVFAADIVSGGNYRIAQNGDQIIQPGLIDVGCNVNNAQVVARLADVATPSLPSSNVDAAIAEVIYGQVDESGSILGIGTISSQTVGASINQTVKKSGRTTGLTRSKISGLNATINVAYDNECAGGRAFTKQFTGQIVISNKGSKFLAGGDSGSLMVQDVATNPRAVGLLYAGSNTSAIANPIEEVLSFLGATMVGQ